MRFQDTGIGVELGGDMATLALWLRAVLLLWQTRGTTSLEPRFHSRGHLEPPARRSPGFRVDGHFWALNIVVLFLPTVLVILALLSSPS